MNGQLPPIDSEIREQLARRSAGRMPDGLLAEVLTALDAAPATKAGARWPRPIWHAPRLAAAGLGAALVAILAVAFAFPAFRGAPAASPAGYPAERALTTAELAALLAGPALPTNTTLVASVTIDARTDVCPMNSRPTIGVVEGMGSQVCVMGATLQARFSGANATGTFAFRYLAPGYLGLLGPITPASTSKLAFQVTEDWPLGGNTFLVEGWLLLLRFATDDSAFCPGGSPVPAGDPLDPNGSDPCVSGWLNQEASPLPSRAADHLEIPKQARYVEAAGMSLIDAIPGGVPVAGVYVVRSVTDRCGNASPQDNPGCAVWRVMARVADVSIPRAAVAPTPRTTVSAIAGYPADRALTTAELAGLMAGPALPINTALVASVTIDAKSDVCPMNRYPTIGVVAGMGPQVCVMGAGVSAYLKDAAATGIFAFRYLAPGYLGLLGEITPASASKLQFSAGSDWAAGGKTFLVSGWLGANPVSCPQGAAASGGDPLDPNGTDPCETNWLTDDPNGATPSPEGEMLGVPGGGRIVEAGGMRLIDNIPGAAPVHGVYVVGFGGTQCPVNAGNSGVVFPVLCQGWRVLARVPDITTVEPSAQAATPTPTTEPPATPIGPTASAGTPHVGYPTDRALTTAELAAVMAGPAPAANTALVARVTINGKTYCPTDAYASIGVVEGMRSQVCVEGDVLTLPKVTATFAFRYLRRGVVENLGQIEPASSSRLLFRATDGWPWEITGYRTFLVGGYLAREPTGSRIVDAPSGPAPASGYMFQTVVVDAAAGVDSIGPSQYCVFVVVATWVVIPAETMGGTHGDGIAFHVVAKVAEISMP